MNYAGGPSLYKPRDINRPRPEKVIGRASSAEFPKTQQLNLQYGLMFGKALRYPNFRVSDLPVQ